MRSKRSRVGGAGGGSERRRGRFDMRIISMLLLSIALTLAATAASAAQGVVCRTDGDNDPKDALLRAVLQLNSTVTAGNVVEVAAGANTRSIKVRGVSAPTITVIPDGSTNRGIACVTVRGPLVAAP
jgi:hypothetical protein